MSEQAQAGRGVLEAGFAVVAAVAGAPGCGVSELARTTGLPKSTVFRLARQLVEGGVLERFGEHYYVGRRVAEWGDVWRPHPALHRSAIVPVRRFADRARGWVGVFWQHDDAPSLVAEHCGGGVPFSVDVGCRMWQQTAAARLLLATTPEAEVPLGHAHRRWAGTLAGIRADGMVAYDRHSLMHGVNCVATPLRLPGMTGRAVLCAVFFGPDLPTGARRASEAVGAEITRNWGASETVPISGTAPAGGGLTLVPS